jgi:hypothetical protein
MTTPDFNDLTPPADLIWKAARGINSHASVAVAAARWGARHGYEQARQLWPEPITDRPPTEEDGDDFEDVQILSHDGRWKVAHWSTAKDIPWLHTPRWQPRPPSLQEQALVKLRAMLGDSSQVWCTEVFDVLHLALSALAQAGGVADALPPDYIDANMQGQDREILTTYYSASFSEGGTADEVILRGIRAVLARYGTAPSTRSLINFIYKGFNYDRKL